MPRSKQLSQQMRAESRAQLLKAARRLFAEQGYFNCKVADIARAAGMSTGNVYWYFPSKEALLKAILAEGFQAQADVLSEAAAYPGDGRAKLERAVERYMAFSREGGEFVSILMALLSHGGQPLMQRLGFDMAQIGAGYHRSLASILVQGQREGSVIDVEPNVLAMVFFSLFSGLMVVYGQEWTQLPPSLVRDAALRLLGVPAAGQGGNDDG